MTELAFAFEYPLALVKQPVTPAPANKEAEHSLAHLLGLAEGDVALLRCASNGMVDKLIAKDLGCEAAFIHQRWRRIRRLLKANDRSHAVAIVLSLGIIPAPDRALALSARHRPR